MVWWITRDIRSRDCISWKISGFIGISKLESQLQDWNMCKFSTSSNHNALWFKEVRDSKASRRSFYATIDYWANRFPRLRNAWCEDCGWIEKDFHECALPKESKCRRAASSKKTTDSYEGDKTAYMIYEHFRATRAYEPVQGPSDLFKIRLEDDDVQDLDTRWNHALLAASEIPTETVLESVHNSK